MKTFAAKDRKPASSSAKLRSVHLPSNAHLRGQRASVHQIVQPKVSVGQPNDHFEQEADRVADRVVANRPVADISPVGGNLSTPVSRTIQAETDQEEPDVQRQVEEEEEEPVQTKLLQRQAEKEEEEEPVQTKLLQRQDKEEEEEPVQTKLLQRQDKEEEEEPVQTKLLQRQDKEEEEEPVQTKLLQRLAGEEEEETVQAKGGMTSMQAASQAVNSPPAGAPLRADVKSTLEAGIGADFSAVRVHDDGAAHDAAASINARAFTHGNDIWLGAGESQSDLHLMAHEATHVVQQSGGLRAKSREISSTSPRVQGWWNPVSAISNAVSSAVEWVGDTIGQAVDYIKEKALEFVQKIPGYSLFTVVNGSDPITGRTVERNGRNFIEAGLDIIPNGATLKEKLNQEGALEEAAQWLDGELKTLDFSPTEIASQFSNFWSSLTIADATRLSSVLDRLANIILSPLERIARFAINVAAKLLEIVKNYVISALIDFIKEHTNAYPLLTQILERDPISNEPVERTSIGLLRGFMQLSESGQEQLRQMEESGSLQKAADWIDGAVARLNISWELIRESFTRLWDLVSIQSLMNPRATFLEIYNIVAAPAGRIINFVIEVAVKLLGFIKDALISKLVDYARTIRGYPLIGVILGKDPFSQEPVERNTANIVHGFMSLKEGGEQQYQEMEQSGAIGRMSSRIEAAMKALNFTWEYIRGLFITAWNSFSLQDLVAPMDAFRRLLDIFAGPIMKLVNFIWEIIKVVIEVVMEMMNFPIDLIRNIITRSVQAIGDIVRDPLGFLKNLMRAVLTGFKQFFDNILKHLLHGLTGWLFGELKDANINPPADFSFRSILGFVMEVLGITMERIWKKLAERIGEERVAQIRGMIDRLTGIWTFVKDVATRGPVAIWEYIKEKLSNLWDVVLDSVRNWVMTKIIEQITVKLLSMLDPTGIMAVINGFIAFYKAVQSFIRYLREMLEIVNSFVVGVAEIAKGSVANAANFLENAMGNAMPVIVGFLANQVGLGGIGRKIGEMIEKVREMVDKALGWLVDKAVSMGTSFLNTMKGALGLGGKEAGASGGATGDWRDQEGDFTEDGQHHEVTYDGSNILIASKTPKSLETRFQEREQQSPPLTPDQRAAITSAIQKKQELKALEQRYSEAQTKNEQSQMLSIEADIGKKLQDIANIIRDSDLFVGDSTIPEIVDILDPAGNVQISGFSRNTRTGNFIPSLFDGATSLSKVRYQDDQGGAPASEKTIDLGNSVDLNYVIHEAHTIGYPKPTGFRAVDRGNEEEASSYQRQRDAFPAISRNWFAETEAADADRIDKLEKAGLVAMNTDGLVRGAAKWIYIYKEFLSDDQKAKIPKPIRKDSMVAILNDDTQFNDADRKDISTKWKERWAQSTHIHHITPLNFGGSNSNFVPLSAEKHVGGSGIHPNFWNKLKPLLISLKNLRDDGST